MIKIIQSIITSFTVVFRWKCHNVANRMQEIKLSTMGCLKVHHLLKRCVTKKRHI